MTDEKILRLRWELMDWQLAEKNLRDQQAALSLAAARKNFPRVKKLQREIVRDFKNRCLAVRHVCKANSPAGVDGVKWSTALEKVQAAEKLVEEYCASPMHTVKFRSKNNGKIRHGHLLTYFDRAMNVLHIPKEKGRVTI